LVYARILILSNHCMLDLAQNDSKQIAPRSCSHWLSTPARSDRAKIAEIRHELGGKGSAVTKADGPTPATVPKKPVLSAAARRRIAAAQRKRWAAVKASKESQPKKQTMSAAGRKHIIEATKKRWAEFRRKKAAAKSAR
jgi:hypothetical protein